MSTVRERAVENATGIISTVILGLGFVALFANVHYFFLIWIIGFAVVMPIVSMLFGGDEDEAEDETAIEEPRYRSRPPADHTGANDDSTPDALATLRERYARGELTDAQFERKLDKLFETESPESAAEWRAREIEHERLDERT